ncbi:hypothetical protein D3C77_737160 [compost metagenome]
MCRRKAAITSKEFTWTRRGLGSAIGAAPDIGQASRRLGHSKEEITKRVYRRVGEVVSPTK